MSTPRTVYVASDGDDTRGQGTTRRPFRTVERARSLIRAQGWNVDMTADQVVSIAPGDYWDHGKSTFTEADSGSNGFNVVYQCSGEPGEASLRGGIRLTNWVLHSGSIYKTRLDEKVYTLWENGRRARCARLPKLNPGTGFEAAFAPYFLTLGEVDDQDTIEYDPGDIDPAAWELGDAQVVAWSTIFDGTQIDWFTDTHPVSAINAGAHLLTLSQKMKLYAFKTGSPGARYFVQGDLSMLTEAGEFVWSDGWLYYWPEDGAIADQEIVAPTVKRVLSLVGNNEDDRVSYVKFIGLEVQYSDFESNYRFGVAHGDLTDTWDYGWQRQNANVRHGLIHLENTDHVQVLRCHVKHSGLAGIWLRGYGQQDNIEDTWVEHAGTSCVFVEGRDPGDGDVLHHNRYWNLKLNNFGELAGDGSGIHVSQSGDNQLRYMLISDGPRYGLEMTGWAELADPADNYTTDNDSSYLRILRCGQDSGDMGALTANFLNRTGVNYFDQVIIDGATAHASMLDVVPGGVFLDNQSDGQHLSNVQVTNVQGNQFRVNDSPANTHVITNCSFQADGSPNPSFNPALMSPDIGLTDEFPFAV